MRKCYKTIYVYEVLSEDPIPRSHNPQARLVLPGIGCHSTLLAATGNQELTNSEMVVACLNHGIDPAFFGIDDEGNDPGEGT